MMSVDGTDFRIQEPTPFSRIWYSHKFKGAGLRYEVGVSINKGFIVWTNGPYPCGSYTDIVIFRDQLKACLLVSEVVLADKGYVDNQCTLNIPGRSERYASLLRARHETLNGRFKAFSVLNSKFRHDLSKHVMCFMAVASCCQISILSGDNLFEIQ